MAARAALCLLVLYVCGADARGADASKPHPHQGILQKYERQPPKKYGISVDGIPVERLRSGKPVLKVLSLKSGFKRAVSIQDVPAPPDVVWGRIMDLDNYPKMVEGCTKCAVYRKKRSLSGKQQVWAKYRICAGPFSMEYFIEHTYEPSKNCMTFHLDYERLSEFSDTVGYWYVERVEDGWSRVYYSADSQLPSWVPGFARDKLIQQALRQSTSWVDRHAQRAMGKGGAEPRPLLRRLKQAGAVALALSLKTRFLPGVQPLKAPREALRRLLRK